MKIAILAAVLITISGSLFSHVEYPNKQGGGHKPYTIVDMALSSPKDDPEPYLIDYIKGKDKADVKKISVIKAPNTENKQYAAYLILVNNQCRNLWLVKFDKFGEAAVATAVVMPCDKAEKAGLLQKGSAPASLTYSKEHWPAD